MKTYAWWISWYDDPNGPHGKHDAGVTCWVSGERPSDGFQTRCARVVAPTEALAWAAADVMFPGASRAERRFSERNEPDWWPDAGRFPRTKHEEQTP